MLASRRPAARRRRGRMLLAIVAAIAVAIPTALTAVGIDAQPASAAVGDSFADDAPTVFITQKQPTLLYKAVQGTGDVTFERQNGSGYSGLWRYNGVAYRTADDYVYGMRSAADEQFNRNLVRIGEGGNVTDLGRVGGLPSMADVAWNAGTFGTGAYTDTYFLRPAWNTLGTVGSNHMSKLYTIDFNGLATSAVSGPALTANSLPLWSGTTSNRVVMPNTSDLFFLGGYVWGYVGSQNGYTRTFYRIDPATGETRSFQVPAGLIDGETFGAQWVYGNGNVGVSNNSTGRITQIAIADPASATPTFTRVSTMTGPANSLNDGTSKQGGAADLEIAKTVSSGQVIAGSSFTYTITVTNNSTTEWSSGFVANDLVPSALTKVSSPTAGCSVAAGSTGTAVQCIGTVLAPGASTTITILATLPAGTTACITNTGTVLGNEDDPNPGNNTSSVDVCPALPGLTLAKTSNAVTDTRQGDTVRYTVTATNTGGAAYTTAQPATVTDDLTGVLDDATYNANATATMSAGASAGTLSYTEPRLTWSGPLAAGASVTLSYTVTLGNTGDGVVRNVAFEGGGTTPECDPPIGGKDPATGVPCAETELLLPRLTIAKTADLTELPSATGDIIYTVTVTNVGPGDITAGRPATVLDDLLGPGARIPLTGAVTVSTGTAAVHGPTELEWRGALAHGESATITVTVHYVPPTPDPSDPTVGIVTNTACILQPELVLAGAQRCASVELLSHAQAQWKEVTASADPILTGTVLTYTLHFANQGTVPFDVDAVDHLADVLDDTTFTSGPTVSPAAALTAAFDAGTETIAIAGQLAVGASATVTYTVTVEPEADRGTNVAVNFLLPPGTPPPPECEPSTDLPTCTETPLPGSLLWQKIDSLYDALAGSEWSLTPVDAGGAPIGTPLTVTDCVALSASQCTGADQDPAGGDFRLVGLDYGYYRLAETRAPAGYVLDTDLLPLVLIAGAVKDLAVEPGFPRLVNAPQVPPSLPLTGGVGEDAFRISAALGAVLILGLLCVRTVRRSRASRVL